MPRTALIRATAVIAALGGGWLTYTQNPQPPPPIGVQKLKDDLYVIGVTKGVGAGNVAAYVTDEGVILVDDMFDRNHDELLEKLKSVTDQPIKYVLNTHQHDDHSGGNAKMLAMNAEVISHRDARANMVLLKQPGQARVTFSEEMEVYLGGKEVRARHYGRGHTGGDAVMYFPAAKVIHTGDLFLTFPPQPFIDYANGGSALEWTKTLDAVTEDRFRRRDSGARTDIGSRGDSQVPRRISGHARSHPRHAPGGRKQRRDLESASERLPLGGWRPRDPASGRSDRRVEVIC